MHAIDMRIAPGREAARRCARPDCDKPAGGWDRSQLCCACALEVSLFERDRRWEALSTGAAAASECSR